MVYFNLIKVFTFDEVNEIVFGAADDADLGAARLVLAARRVEVDVPHLFHEGQASLQRR